MAVWVQIYYLWGGSMFLLHVYVCMRLAQGASNKYASLESPFAGRPLAVAWQSGEFWPLLHLKMTSSLSFIITANPRNLSIYYSNSPIANILHMYTGKIMLSFCPDMASSTDPSPMIIPYRTTL